MRILSWILTPSIFFLFWLFLKMGLVFFGGGYVVIPIMHRELVTNLHLMTELQFLDGIAISQLTPGPVAIMATFSGYCISGIRGALVGTFAMFLPSTLLMLLLSEWYDKIKNSIFGLKLLNKIIPAIIGLLLSATIQISKTTLTNWIEIAELFLALFLLIRFKTNPALLIIAAAALGFVIHF